MKRGESGLSLIVGVDKPEGMTSHDVVNRVRRCFGEKRVGHAGTLDPLASGVLPILIGPATRLSDHIMGHDKTYAATISFGVGTSTDDAEGEIIRQAGIPGKLTDEAFARSYLDTIIGKQNQLPPSYSAIKVNGKKAYSEARKGNVINLEARPVEIYEADLVSIDADRFPESLYWSVIFKVSKGTYIRSIARDIGFDLECPAHIKALRRLRVGNMDIDDCVTLETLEEVGQRAALDPVRILGYGFSFIDGDNTKALMNGQSFNESDLKFYRYKSAERNICACTSGIIETDAPKDDGEAICMICDNSLKAIYGFDRKTSTLKPESVFQIGIERGCII